MNKIKLTSRYKDITTELELIEGNRGIITSNSAFIRTILNENAERLSPKASIQAIDYEGGPMLSVGDSVGAYKIKSIRTVHLIEFE